MANNNNQAIEKLICDCCDKDITLSTNYFYCLECPEKFYWCRECFYKTSTDDNTEYTGGKAATNTRSGHIHPFKEVIIDITTPSKKKYSF